MTSVVAQSERSEGHGLDTDYSPDASTLHCVFGDDDGVAFMSEIRCIAQEAAGTNELSGVEDGKGFEHPRRLGRPEFAAGDKVKVKVKVAEFAAGEKADRVAIVLDPDWHNQVKVKMCMADSEGAIKSFYPVELELATDLMLQWMYADLSAISRVFARWSTKKSWDGTLQEIGKANKNFGRPICVMEYNGEAMVDKYLAFSFGQLTKKHGSPFWKVHMGLDT